MPKEPSEFRARIVGAVLGVAVAVVSLFCALAIHYWVSWPLGARVVGAWLFPAVVLGLWFIPGPRRGGAGLAVRRGAALALIAGLLTAYALKTPVERDWVDLQAHTASVALDGDRVTIRNYRDAVHQGGRPSVPRWTTETFHLSQLEGADLIIQPFGGVKALAHVMLSFRFADGRHVVVSMEARQAKGARFDALAGFFRHDQLYPELATERDLFWERLSRTPPDEIEIYPIRKSPDVLRVYFQRILRFANAVDERPIFYSTLSESCMTTFINLAPESFAAVPWYDLRRWMPGYSLSLFQQLGLVEASLSTEDVREAHRLRADIRPPSDFPTAAAWSLYVRSEIGRDAALPLSSAIERQ